MFATVAFLFLVLPRSAWAAEGGCAGDDPAACGQAEVDASEVKVVMMQSSIGLQPLTGGCSGSGEGDATRCSQADIDANSAEVFMLQSAMGLKGQEGDAQIEAESADVEANLAANATANVTLDVVGPGSPGCPCIGIDYNTSGEIYVQISGKNATFPADMGASCQFWDYNRHPDCRNSKAPQKDPAWCLEKWCYVDPCNCDLTSPPKISSYIGSAKIQDKQVFYSYEACGYTDAWTSSQHGDACVNQKTAQECFALSKCSWTLTQGCVGKELAGSTCAAGNLKDAGIWGFSDCPCVGVNGTEGYVEGAVTSGNSTTMVRFPSDIGATCKAWDINNHPECRPGGSNPSWCKQKWCNVDPCKCKLKTPPKLSTYFQGATWLGHQIYYSYAACGETDAYTATMNKNACVNKKDKASCLAMGKKCLWTIMDLNYVCVGADLGNLCYAGAAIGGPNSHSERASLFFGAAPLLAVAALSLS